MAEKYLVRKEDEDVTIELSREEDGLLVRRNGGGEWKRASHFPTLGMWIQSFPISSSLAG